MVDNKERPSVAIAVDNNSANNSFYDYICCGLEEEGIPFNDVKIEEGNLNLMAHQAAESSRLNVGIALGANNEVIIHHKKLEVNNPFLAKKIDKNFQAQIIGSNAARLVKGIPVKEIPQELNYEISSAPENLIEIDSELEKERKTEKIKSDKNNYEEDNNLEIENSELDINKIDKDMTQAELKELSSYIFELVKKIKAE